MEWVVSVQHCSTQFLWYRRCQFIGGTNGIWEINRKYVIYKAYWHTLSHEVVSSTFHFVRESNVNGGAVVVVIVLCLNLQLPVQSVPITTKVVSSNPVHGEMSSIEHYVIKFVSDLREIGVLGFPPSIKLTTTI